MVWRSQFRQRPPCWRSSRCGEFLVAEQSGPVVQVGRAVAAKGSLLQLVSMCSSNMS